MSSAEQPSRLRADARRNRDAVVTAARAVFAEEGLDAPLDAIARRAGVGRATIYRRFATRDALIRAIFDDNLDALQRVAEEAPDEDRAYLDVLAAAAGMLAADRGFVEALGRRRPSEAIAGHVEKRLLAVIAEPLRRAQRAGLVRDDLKPGETLLILDMIGGAALAAATSREGGRERRALELLIDALRCGAGSGTAPCPRRG